MWPDSGRLPGPRQATAQEVARADSGPAAVQPNAKKQNSLEAKLDKPVTVEFVDTPVRDALAFLAESSDVQFYIKQKQLQQQAITPDDTVTLSLKDIRLSTALDLLLAQLDLTYVQRDELLIVTTIDDAEATMEVRVYDCRELLKAAQAATTAKARDLGPQRSANAMPGGEARAPSSAAARSKTTEARPALPVVPQEVMPQFFGVCGGTAMPGMGRGLSGGYEGDFREYTPEVELVDLIQRTVEPASWDEIGGDGSIATYNGLLAVRQSPRMHAKVERVLNLLQAAVGLEATKVQVTK
jgi:type II secretory pathway component GspD/PulD (secretin)